MAKGELCSPVEYQPSLYLDFKDEEEAKEFIDSLNDKVTVVVQGKLTSVSLGDNNCSVRIEGFKVQKVPNNVFAELSDD